MSYNFKSVAVCLILLNEIISNFPLFLPKSSRSLKCDPEISDIWEFSHNLLEIDFQFNSIILRYDSLAHCIVYLCKYCVKDLKLKKNTMYSRSKVSLLVISVKFMLRSPMDHIAVGSFLVL